MYVVPADESIKVYTEKSLHKDFVDTATSLKIAFFPDQKPQDFENYVFRQNSLDADILSILLKYRPSINGFPNQLNTSILNGALYLGYRTDLYKLTYTQSPLRIFRRDIVHYGFSFGIFTGVGSSGIDEFVTQNGINIQYDGFLNVSGIAVIIALNKLTFGLTFGADHLLDKNRKAWIYQGKPWVGLSVGLNLN